MQKKKHPGFKNVSEMISRNQRVPIEVARAILAKSTRKASKKAKRKNPRLLRVK